MSQTSAGQFVAVLQQERLLHAAMTANLTGHRKNVLVKRHLVITSDDDLMTMRKSSWKRSQRRTANDRRKDAEQLQDLYHGPNFVPQGGGD